MQLSNRGLITMIVIEFKFNYIFLSDAARCVGVGNIESVASALHHFLWFVDLHTKKGSVWQIRIDTLIFKVNLLSCP